MKSGIGYTIHMPMISKQQTNQLEEGRLLAIGDIHGCLDQLRDLIRQINLQPEDRIVFLGDYIDRGPDSAGVVEYLLELEQHCPRCVFLRGNHEQMFLEVLSGGEPTMFLHNGGDKTLQSYRSRELWPLPEEHRRFFSGLDCLYETADFIFVHAGLRPGIPVHEQLEQDLLWIRHEFIDSNYDWGKTVVFGHTPLAEPYCANRRIGLDTGCVYGRVLTCCEVRTLQTWQA